MGGVMYKKTSFINIQKRDSSTRKIQNHDLDNPKLYYIYFFQSRTLLLFWKHSLTKTIYLNLKYVSKKNFRI